MFIFYSIHYPRPEFEPLLVESMHEFGEQMQTQPGLLFVAPFPFKNVEAATLMGVTVWVSEEAFAAAMVALTPLREQQASHEEWERKPTEVYRLSSAR